MTPPPPAANATAARKAAPARGTRQAPQRAPLKVVASGRPVSRLRRLMSFAPLAIVVCTLVAVVVGQTLLANGQVRLSGLTQQVQQAQGTHRQLQLEVSALEMPSRIVATAVGPLHMVHPTEQQLPYVSLTTPLPTPHVTPAPVTGTATTGAAGAAASTGSADTTASSSHTSNTQTPPQ